MAMNTTEQLATLTRLLNTPGLAALPVRVTLQGELQLEVNGPGPLERIKLLLEAGVITDIYAAVVDKGGQPSWLKTCIDLFDAVQNGWLVIATTPVGPSPDVIVTTSPSYIPAPPGAVIGDILVFNGFQWTSLAAGPSSYVLTSNGVGFIPSYQPSSGGGGGTIGGSIGKYQVAHGVSPNVIGGSSRLQWNYDTNVFSLSDGTSYLTIQTSIIDTSATTLQLGGSAAVSIGGNYTLPTTDGAPGQVLTTDGSGVVSWGEGTSGNPNIKSQVTAGLSEGDICFLSGANTWSKAQANSTLTAATTGGVFNGTSGSIDILGSVINSLKCTTDGGMPTIGSRLYLATATADSGTGAGKATAIPPEPPSGGTVNLQIVGICVDNTNYAASKTVKAIFQPSYPTILVG